MKTLHSAFRVSNVDRSLEFYTGVGYRELGRVVDGDLFLVMLNLPGDGDTVTLELAYERHQLPIVRGNSFSHLVIQTDDIAATMAGLQSRGIATSELDTHGATNGPKTCFIEDPDGHRIELVQWPAGHPKEMTRADFRKTPAAE